MAHRKKEIVIPKEQALFWLDRNGFWQNQTGKFQHRKIINYFHASIRKDRDGYHLFQTHGNYREKVYFPYEETALFVFDVRKDDDIVLILNTKKQIKLKPKKLFIKEENLYMDAGEDQVKFTDQSLIKIANLLEFEDDRYFIRVKGRRYRIANQGQA